MPFFVSVDFNNRTYLRVLGHYAHTRLLGKVYRKLLAVDTSYLHRTIKKWITSSCSKNQEVRTNNRIVISDCTLKIKIVRSGEPLVLHT